MDLSPSSCSGFPRPPPQPPPAAHEQARAAAGRGRARVRGATTLQGAFGSSCRCRIAVAAGVRKEGGVDERLLQRSIHPSATTTPPATMVSVGASKPQLGVAFCLPFRKIDFAVA